MSSQWFSCTVTSQCNLAVDFFRQLKAAFSDLPSAEALIQVNSTLDTQFDRLVPILLDIAQTDTLEVSAEFGSDVPFALLEAIVQKLDAIEGVVYKARYFDSASAGVQVWGDYPELDLDGKSFYFTGKCLEKEYLEEMLEDLGEIQEEFDESTEVLIIGDKPNQKILKQAIKQGAIVIGEDELVEFFSNLP